LERAADRGRAIATLRDQIAPGATDAELAFFAQVCGRLDLSPFADQIVCVGRFDKRANRTVFRHQITVAGRRALAARTGRLQGIEGPVWCGPRAGAGELVWRDVWDDNDVAPYCARVLVHVAGWTVPANGTAKWSEFAQFDHSGKLLPLWRSMPSHMLGKVAESMALRRAFPDVIDPAVMESIAVDAPYMVAVADSVVGQDDDDDVAGELAEAVAVSAGDQTAAHKAVAGLDVEVRDRWLAEWRIDDFGSAWPADAVADAIAFAREPPS
jgi:hypothetical protein